MLKYIKYYLIFMLPFIMGCSESLYIDEMQANSHGELPIDFDFELPDASNMRGFNGDVKIAFTTGDMIHMLGTFNTKELQEDGSYKEGKLSRYGALKYDGKNWIAAEGSNLTWPSIATDGEFKAYYISESNGVLTDATPSAQYPLSKVTPLNDPLKAESEKIVYGHAVKLQFSHICTYLTLIDLEPQVSTSYWFKRDGVNTFNNAFQIVLGKDNLGPTLDFEFCQQPNPTFNDLVYIAADAVETIEFDDNNKEKIITKANYFLEPGNYDTFSLCYQAGENSTYDYLEYDYNKIPENVGGKENIRPTLEAGQTYTLTITKSPGITINSPSSGEGWDESNNYFEVDVEDFLKAINDNKDYDYTDPITQEKTRILESTANRVKLLHNVDFRFRDYSTFKDKNFRPNIEEGLVFDGDYHYIRNLACPLFRYNYGTIQNVGIKDIKIDATSHEEKSENDDMSRHGALCMWNRNHAKINNIRVTDVDMTISVRSGIETEENGSEIHNIGCVIGSNTGEVREVALAGKFSLLVKGEEGKPVNDASLLIGGFVGQNAALGEIYNVSPFEGNLSVKITNECIGDNSSYSVGGIVGRSSGFITGAILSDITIDGSKSSGVTSYMGGIAGELSVSDGTASINSCIVSGSVTAGITKPYQAITSVSYIGGIAGADLSVPVIDCRTAVSVKGTTNADNNVIYATGGAFGRIRESSNYTFENLIAYGSLLDGPNASGAKQYVGNFAGIVPQGQEWSKDYADKNIIVRKFGNYENIGAALDNNNK